MPKYKPGQFVKVNIPGRYRANKAKGHPCMTCDIREECILYSILNRKSPFGIYCRIAIRLHGNVKKVK